MEKEKSNTNENTDIDLDESTCKKELYKTLGEIIVYFIKLILVGALIIIMIINLIIGCNDHDAFNISIAIFDFLACRALIDDLHT